ncbi:MAG: hypothetical protein D6784_00465 [Chloroflexi bacterium]|nr:MAG: hypothetical protein D6784_00465 [Chloroflexota bacterium]
MRHSPFNNHQAKLILLVAWGIFLHGLAADSFWGDEILTAMFAGQSPAEVIRWTASDIHPPLYYLLAGTFTRLTVPLGGVPWPTPASDWLWRFPSVAAAVLAAAATYRLARHLSGLLGDTLPRQKWTAAGAAFLLSLAPIAVKYAQEARMHGLFMLWAALSTWLFFRAVTGPAGWRHWLAYALAMTAAVYTMYFGFLLLASHAAYLLFTLFRSTSQGQTRRSIPAIRRFAASVGLVVLLYGPWWPVLIGILRKRAAVGAIEGGVGSPLGFIRGVIQALGPLPEPVAWGFLALFLVGLVIMTRRHWPLAGFAAVWLALPVLLPIVLGDPRALQFRYAFVLPVYLAVIAWLAARLDTAVAGGVSTYLLWLLATVSFIASLNVFNQTKPDWRAAAAYLNEHTGPGDIILVGPLWDEGRFIGYYYHGPAQLLTPAAMVANIERRAESLRLSGSRVWAVNRFAPAMPALKNIDYTGVVVSEPTVVVYEPEPLAGAALELARQAVDAAYPWAEAAQRQGVLDPDPRTARAAALRALGDALVAAGRPQEALEPYRTAVAIFPGWVDGYLTLAETEEAVGNIREAVEAYRQAAFYNLKWRGPAADEAAALAEAGQWQAALEKYHRLVGRR